MKSFRARGGASSCWESRTPSARCVPTVRIRRISGNLRRNVIAGTLVRRLVAGHLSGDRTPATDFNCPGLLRASRAALRRALQIETTTAKLLGAAFPSQSRLDSGRRDIRGRSFEYRDNSALAEAVWGADRGRALTGAARAVRAAGPWHRRSAHRASRETNPPCSACSWVSSLWRVRTAAGEL